MMKVLQVNKLYAPEIGGVETVVKDIAEGLSPHTDMRVLVCRRRGRQSKEVLNNVKVTRCTSLGVLMSMPLSLDFFRQYRRMSKEADVVQLHAPFPLADLALWLYGCKGKLVIWWHSDIIRQKTVLKLLKPFLHHTLKRADTIIVAAQGTMTSSEFLPDYARKCKVIPFGLDFGAYPKLEGSDYLKLKLRNRNSKALLFVGRLVYYKGLDYLIEAMKSVKNAELFVVGTGPLERELKAKAYHNGRLCNIHFLGNLPRKALLMAFSGCDIFVFPSCANSEAFGLTQVEAMYYGKPVINTNLPTGVPDVSIHGETGLTVPVGDAVALAEAINQLVHDDELRETYGKNAVARVQACFNRSHMLQKVYEVYTC